MAQFPFQEVLQFISEHRWLIDHWSTHFIHRYDELGAHCVDEESFYRRCKQYSVDRTHTDSAQGERRFNRKGMSMKKQHEVAHLLPLLHDLSASLHVLVDVGAGRCQSSKAFIECYPGHSVICLEGSMCICEGRWSPDELVKSGHAGLCIKTVHVDGDTRLDVCDEYLMYSLHACGRLSPDMIKVWIRDDKARVLCNIGCCYHFLANLMTVDVSSEWSKDAFALANHGPGGVTAEAVESLYRRALLQIVAGDSTTARTHVRRRDFTEYMRANGCTDVSSQDLHMLYAQHEHKKLLLHSLWKMRSALGPVIESLILYDRVQYLRDAGYEDAHLQPVWDPSVSPRNIAIIARK